MDEFCECVSMVEKRSQPERSVAPSEGRSGSLIRLRVQDLLQGTKEAILEHAGQEYRLRVTSTGKLILTK